MNARTLVAALAAAIAVIPAAAGAVEVAKTETASLDIGGRLQAVGNAQYLDDASRSDARMYMFLKQARLQLNGEYSGVKMRAQIAFGGEAEIKAPTPGISLGLLDLFADVPVISSGTYVRVGQFKVPYSRERLLDSGFLLFSERTVTNSAFRIGRDMGIALHTKTNRFVGAVGLFTGGGRDIPERYLPQRLGVPMLVARAGYDTGVGENAFVERSNMNYTSDTILQAPEKLNAAFFVNGMYTEDSIVGHSSVLNTKVSEKSLILNSNWNPYIGKAPLTKGKYWQIGADAVARIPVGPGTLSGEVEGNFGVYQNAYGDIRVPGARVQTSYAWYALALSARYAVIMPDENFMNGTSRFLGKRAIQEVAPSITYEFKAINAKLIADLPILIGTPVIQEPGIGGYVLTEMPDQAAMVTTKTAAVERQNVIGGRLMFQATF